MTRVPHLREQMVAHLQRIGAVRDPRLARAFGAVAREAFIDVDPSVAYEDRAIEVKREAGVVLSSLSQPAMIAAMLEMLDVHRESRVLEIGTGTGYTTALLAQLSGTTITTVDIEPDLVDAARERFERFGINARASVGDGAALSGLDGSFDRILVTARAADIPNVWRQRLTDGARLVVPLDIGLGSEAAFAFVKRGDMLESDGAAPCVFLPLRTVPQPEAHVFFHSPSSRSLLDYARARMACAPVAAATPQWLERYDVVVAREESVFGLTAG